MTYGACGLVVQTFLLRALLGWLGEQRVLCLGLGANLLQARALCMLCAALHAACCA